ncbi:MAG: tail fiber domain-containing protein, partial [Candidatus Delongbacteria bacterium]|nr:tail fiber domain-containing protein [Candidatus Delongbacteria bacterium]
NTIMKMRPVTYLWKDKPERGRKVGLIAQELIEVLPEVVNVGDDEDQTLGINYAELTPILIKALQEQQEEMESMKKEMSEMKKIIETLRK